MRTALFFFLLLFMQSIHAITVHIIQCNTVQSTFVFHTIQPIVLAGDFKLACGKLERIWTIVNTLENQICGIECDLENVIQSTNVVFRRLPLDPIKGSLEVGRSALITY